MALPSSSWPSCWLFTLRFERLAISILASVVSEGSPGSSCCMLDIGMPLLGPFSAAVLDRVLGRFAGGFVESIDAVVFLCLLFGDGCAPDSSPPSSPEASREEGCWSSAIDDFFIAVGRFALRFRFAEPEDEGEDIVL